MTKRIILCFRQKSGLKAYSEDPVQDTPKGITTECRTDGPQKIKGDPEFMAGVQEAKVQNNISTEDTPDDPEINQTEESPQVDKITSTENISI